MAEGRMSSQREFALVVTAAGFLFMLSAIGCPRMGDPHIETGFRVGPVSSQTAAALVRTTCAGSADLPRGSYLWGGPTPMGAEHCSDVALCATSRHSSVLVRSIRCNEKYYVYAFF